MPRSEHALSALIYTPHGRDAALASDLLEEAGARPCVCPDIASVVEGLDETAGFAVIAAEAMRHADLRALTDRLAAQPPWSDVPIILLTHRGGGPERNPEAARLSETLGNVNFLERPFHPTTFVSLARTALRSGQRQLEARARIIEVREGEAALREAKASLEHRVAERTAELADANDRLIREIHEKERMHSVLVQSQKMEAVGQLTGGVAHDFNNLLTIIRSSVDFLRREDVSAVRRERYVDAISQTVDRAAKLTGQLLAFARRQALVPVQFDVGAQVESVAELVRPLVGARIVIEVKTPVTPCYAKADISQFETALINLAVNARDAMDGEGTLSFRVEAVEDVPSVRGHAGSAGAFVAITVEDTGCGIPSDQLASIFEPFFTTKEVGKGTGLGLSQVFGFAKQSGGEVTVRSQKLSGAVFQLYLPRTRGGEAEAPALPAAAPTLPEQRGLRVLVVEDNDSVGEFAVEMLSDLGHSPVRAANAEEAFAALGEDAGQFDAVFSDVMMPGINGLAMAQILRERFAALPVLLTSGYSHVLAEEGTHGFELLKKPYSVGALAQRLQQVVSAGGKPGR